MATKRPHLISVRLTDDEYAVLRAMPGNGDGERLRAVLAERAESARMREAIRAELKPLQTSIREELQPTRQAVERLDATLDERVRAELRTKMQELGEWMKNRWKRTMLTEQEREQRRQQGQTKR